MQHRLLFKSVCLFITIIVVLTATGCCGRSTKRPTGGKKNDGQVADPSRTDVKNPVDSVSAKNTGAVDISEPESDSQKRSASLYRRLENSFAMFNTDNIDGALRELERVQLEINNDPYLEMQTWYLSAMIYHKTGKSSRRKRSMRKMLEVMEQLQKDPRFRRSFEDGKMSQDVIKLAIEKGEGRYVE